MQEEKGLWSAISTLVEKLGVDPCLLGIVLVVGISAWLVNRAYKHVERMEEIRVGQLTKAIKGKKGDGTS